MSMWNALPLCRSIMDNPLWTAEPFTRGQAWVDMLMLANYKTGFIRVRGILVEVPRGYLGWSQNELAKRWKWSRGKLFRFVSELQKTDMIMIPQKTNVSSLIQIVNYEKYNSSVPQTEPQTEPQTDRKQDTNKNVKKEKNKNSSSDALRLSTLLSELILQNNPTHSQLSNGKKSECVVRWAKPIDTILNRKVPAEDVEATIRWCQSDKFWKVNILSGSKLKEKFDTLQSRRKSDNSLFEDVIHVR